MTKQHHQEEPEVTNCCTHPMRHTVYGSRDPERNGTWCQLCGRKLP